MRLQVARADHSAAASKTAIPALCGVCFSARFTRLPGRRSHPGISGGSAGTSQRAWLEFLEQNVRPLLVSPFFWSHGKLGHPCDVDGNASIDFQRGQGAFLDGHAPDGMADALSAQMRAGLTRALWGLRRFRSLGHRGRAHKPAPERGAY